MGEMANTANVALVVGASGGIGRAVLDYYLAAPGFALVIAVSRSPQPAELAHPSAHQLAHFPEQHGARLRWLVCDYTQGGIDAVLGAVTDVGHRLSRVVICNGILHNDRVDPEKTLLKLNAAAMQEVLHANVVVPSLWVAGLSKVLRGSGNCVIAVLSARVGSIADNRLGGWYSYRASKAALNMVLKSAAVEYARRLPGVKLVAFHPGTTDTALSKPFQRGVAPANLFTPAFVADKLGALLDQAVPDAELSYLAWDGSSIEW
jgi:NAD(P)-dependent dehydrogenase (short-subunit alcohol dehydrogenase family)